MRLTRISHSKHLPNFLKPAWNLMADYWNRYNTYLQKNHPKLYELQTCVTTGTQKTFTEGKDYAVVLWETKVNRKPLNSLTYKQMVLRYQYPQDLMKLGPVLIIMALPFSMFLLIPIVYFFPRVFLTRHFWTEEQKRSFALNNITYRIDNVPTHILPELDVKVKKVQKVHDRELLQHMLYQVKTQKPVHEKDILDVQACFQSTLNLSSFSGNYIHALRQLNYVYTFSRRLAELDKFLYDHPDNNLDNQDVRNAALIRCLYPYGDQEAIRDFLDVWTSTSALLKEPSESLRLHLPVFLSFPHPVNAECRARLLRQF